MIANREQCSDKDKTVCDVNEFSRVRYVHGMLLDDKDFQSEQQYHVSKRKFLNRMLHGSGVVCGLAIKGNKDGQSIEVTPGLALDCAGNEIWVSHSAKIDLTSILPPKKAKGESECEEPLEEKPNTYYIGIRYNERATNPVAIYLPSGGCDERTCENSRYREGYCIEAVECCPQKPFPGLLDDLRRRETDAKSDSKEPAVPAAAQPTRPEATCGHCTDEKFTGRKLEGKKLEDCLTLERFCEQPVPCPQCCSCDKPCHVVLGKITVDEDLRLQTICNNDCRRYVFTAHLFQGMIMRIVGETEEHLASSLVYNPVRAVCELLNQFLIRETKFKIPKDWIEESEVSKVDELRDRVDTMEKAQAEWRKSVEATQSELKKSVEEATVSTPPIPPPPPKKPTK